MIYQHTWGRAMRPAFTLAELLVVIGIVGFLLTLLLPSLQRARDKAYSAHCSSNLRQIMTGVFLYAADHDGQLLPQFVNYSLIANTDSFDGILTRGSYASDDRTSALFWCPAAIRFDGRWLPPETRDRGGAGLFIAAPDEGVTLGYAANGPGVYLGDHAWNRYPFVVWSVEAERDGNMRLVKLSQVRGATTMVAIYDACFWGHLEQVPRVGRHRDGEVANVSMLDGHVEPKEVPREFSIDPGDSSVEAPNLGYGPLWNRSVHDALYKVSGVRWRLDSSE